MSKFDHGPLEPTSTRKKNKLGLTRPMQRAGINYSFSPVTIHKPATAYDFLTKNLIQPKKTQSNAKKTTQKLDPDTMHGLNVSRANGPRSH